MSLAPATRLGPYEILARLGAGGMGEVYRARDTRLGREVALKVLPADVAGDPARRARFEQEARAAAALNHPNIVGLHDVGAENGVSYIITELVSGETLEALIAAGPLPVKKLLDIAAQVADGMAAAHAAGITHRDLKPANIMITGPATGNPGRAKILDFGLARQAAPPVSASGETLTVHHTEPGMILGTVNYMSPEQACGKLVDYRSDQFSFGLILYEMASGKRPFERREPVQTLSAILTDDPPPIERPIPAPFRWVMDRCLAKDPADRYESSRDLYQDLRALRDHLSEASQAAAVAITPRRRVRWQVPAAFAVGALAALVTRYFLAGPPLPDQTQYRFTPFSFLPSGQTNAVWSPDGKSVAYAASEQGARQIFLRYLDSPLPAQLTHLPDAAHPIRFSPDGKRILFSSAHKPKGIWSVATVGGEPQPVAPLSDSSITADISPDNQAIASLQPGADGRNGIWISSPPGAPWKQYLPGSFAAREILNSPQLKFSPNGRHILLIVDGERAEEKSWLIAYPPDPSHPPRVVLPNLPHFSGTPSFSWMPDNRHIVASTAAAPGAPELWIADTVSAEFHALTSGTAGAWGPAVSPDGSRVVFEQQTGNHDILAVDLALAAVHPVIATQRDESMPAWAARQPLLVYVTDRNGPDEIWLHGPGSAERPLITERDFPGVWFMGPALSPEGDRVIYTVIGSGRAVYLWISATTGGAPVRLTNDTSTEFPGSWSPDGAWFAYLALRNGKGDLLKVKTSGQAAPILLKSGASGGVPIWSPAGDWIVAGDDLVSPDGKTVRPLGDHDTPGWGFSADGKLLYGMRSDHDRELFFSIDMANLKEKIIGDVGKDSRPRSYLNPAIRFSLAPDGKSFAYSSGVFKTNLWLLEGFGVKRSFWR